jgi:hypothetical protein
MWQEWTGVNRSRVAQLKDSKRTAAHRRDRSNIAAAVCERRYIPVPIGVGRTAEICAWCDAQVLKL